MAWKEEMLIELESLQESIESRKSEIENRVDKLEEGKKARDVRKREILLKEMKQVLAKLNEVDKNIVKDLKGEAFDFLRGMRKINEEIAAFKDSLEKAPESNRSWKTEVNAMKAKVANLEMEEFVSCLDISVGIQPGLMITGFEKVSDAIYLETPVLDSKAFYLAFPEHLSTFEETNYNVNYFNIRIYSLSEDASFKLTSLLLQKTIVTMTGLVLDVGAKILEEGTVGSMMKKKKTELSEDGKYINIKLRRPGKMVGKISVHLLGSNIVNSPITHTFLNNETTTDPAKSNITLGNESIGIFDMTGLDQSDLNSLDITNRQKKLFAPGKQHLLSNPSLQASPAYHPLRRASQVSNVVPEKLNDTTPFNPNPTYASTMRGTVTASNLAGALGKMSEEAVSTKGGSTPENSKMDDSELSILAPSKNSGVSIDDMQRSLSGSESGAGDRSAFQLDKSVSFAPQTQVVEVLSTPQVSASSGGTRFLVAEGQTKPGDGKKGHVRRLNKDDKEGGYDGIWDLTEVDEENEMEEEYNHSDVPTLPLVTPGRFPLGDSYSEDPHLMLNASKAPSPQKSWPKEDSIWDAIDMEGMVEEFNSCSAATLPLLPRDDLVQDSMSCLDSVYEDPHLMLNASKAPSPQSSWSKEDSIWDWGFEQNSFKNPPREDFNQTIWENETPSPVSKFDFREPLEVVDVYESQLIASSRRGTNFCLISPHSISYVPQRNLFLVSEPNQNRVGVYNAETFKFHIWMDYPKHFAKTRHHYEYPSSILSLSNEFLALIECDRLHIFDSHGVSVQSFGGEYHGLSEGQNGEIFTLSKNIAGQPCVKKLVKTSSNYTYGGHIPLSAIQEFDNWEILSQVRFLMYSNKKIYITDEGLHKMYIVDLIVGKQMVIGYLGSKSGQFKKPTGLMVDDLGNVLVGDSDNNRLLVYTMEGKFLKIVTQQEDWRYSSPHALVRKGNSVLAVFRGEGMGDKGAIVKYKVSGDSGLNTPKSGSEIGM